MSMRMLDDRYDASGPRGGRSIVPKYIFAFEGHRTEFDYFRGIMENRGTVGIPAGIELCILQRFDADSGFSDPGSVLDILDENVRCMKEGKYSARLVMECINAQIVEEIAVSRKDPRCVEYTSSCLRALEPLCSEDGFISDVVGAVELCSDECRSAFGLIPGFFLPRLIDYIDGTDHVCVMVDRDCDAHSPRAMDDFIHRCRASGYRPFIVNPCFEFWLMMHFEDVLNVDRDVTRQNPIVDGKRLTERELDRMLRDTNPEYSYDKTRLDPLMFMHRVGLAMENSRMFCHDIRCLKTEIGTNIGELFFEMCCEASS